MKVFVITHGYDYEGETVHAVALNYENAVARIEKDFPKFKLDNSGLWTYLGEYVVLEDYASFG